MLTRSLPLGSMGDRGRRARRDGQSREQRREAGARIVHGARGVAVGHEIHLDRAVRRALVDLPGAQAVHVPERPVDRARGDERAVGPKERVVDPPLDAHERRHARPPTGARGVDLHEVAHDVAHQGHGHAVERRHEHHGDVLRAGGRHARGDELHVRRERSVVQPPIVALHEENAHVARAVELEHRPVERVADSLEVSPRRERVGELHERAHVDPTPVLLREARERCQVERVALEADGLVTPELVEHPRLVLGRPVHGVGPLVQKEQVVVDALLVRQVADVARPQPARGRRQHALAVRSPVGAVHRARDERVRPHRARFLPVPPALVPQDAHPLARGSARLHEIERARGDVGAHVAPGRDPLLGQRGAHVLLGQYGQSRESLRERSAAHRRGIRGLSVERDVAHGAGNGRRGARLVLGIRARIVRAAGRPGVRRGCRRRRCHHELALTMRVRIGQGLPRGRAGTRRRVSGVTWSSRWSPNRMPNLRCLPAALSACLVVLLTAGCSKAERASRPAAGEATPVPAATAAPPRAIAAIAIAGDAPVSARRVVRTAELSLETPSPDATQGRLVALAEGRGGFVVSSDTARSRAEDGAENVVVTVVLRVPSGAFDATLGDLRAIAGHVSDEKVTGQDVTEEYVDVEARIQAQRAIEAQYLDVLTQAKTIPDILAVQQKLGEVRTEIERAEGRRRYLADQTSLSTFTVHLARPIDALDASGPGFGASIAHAAHDAVDVSIGIIHGLIRLVGVLLPVAVLLGLPAWLIGRTLLRRRRARFARVAMARPQGPGQT